jgi:HAD superfamily hydrolase (TIGR01549 family)
MTDGPGQIPYDAVVFDMDGVLVEPTDWDVLVEAVVEAFADFDVAVDSATAERLVENDAVPIETIRSYGLDPEAVWHTRELRASLAQQAHARDGGKRVYDDVSALERLDVPLGVVSNNQQATVEFLLAYHDLEYFQTASGRAPTLDGAARRKPAPDYIETALADLGTSRALYVGDKGTDLLAAERAGIDGAHLDREHVSEASLPVEPTYQCPDLSTLISTLLEQADRPVP